MGHLPLGRVWEQCKPMLSSPTEGLDEVTGAEVATASPWPATAPGDVHVAEHHRVGAFGVDACRGVLDLQVQVRLARMTVVPDRGEGLATPHPVPDFNREAALHEVGHQHIPSSADINDHVIGSVAVGSWSVVCVA